MNKKSFSEILLLSSLLLLTSESAQADNSQFGTNNKLKMRASAKQRAISAPAEEVAKASTDSTARASLGNASESTGNTDVKFGTNKKTSLRINSQDNKISTQGGEQAAAEDGTARAQLGNSAKTESNKAISFGANKKQEMQINNR